MIQSIVAVFFGREMCLHSTHSCLYFVLSWKKWLEASIHNCQSQMVGEQVFLFCYFLCLSIWNLMSWIGKSKWFPATLPRSNLVPRMTVVSTPHTLVSGRETVPYQTRGRNHHCCCHHPPSAEAPSLCVPHSPSSSWQWPNRWTYLWAQRWRSVTMWYLTGFPQRPPSHKLFRSKEKFICATVWGMGRHSIKIILLSSQTARSWKESKQEEPEHRPNSSHIILHIKTHSQEKSNHPQKTR